jgi:hypothetical protein
MLHIKPTSRWMARHPFVICDSLRSSIELSVIMLGVLLALLLLHGMAHADGIVVIGTGADYTFAQQMTFTVTARSDVDIRSAEVVFRTRNGPERRGIGVLTPGRAIQAMFVQQLAGGVLPPFSPVTFWWELTDAAGRKTTTPPVSRDYLDNRFKWQETTEGSLHIWSYAGDVAYARSALDVARSARTRVNQELETQLPPRVDIYLYTALDDLQSALLLAGRDWQGGQARPDLGVVLVAIAPGQGALAQMKRDIPHELTHLLVYQATGAGYPRVPRWLDEGLATANEELAQPEYQLALEAAYRAGQLIPLETLCAPFSSEAGVAQLSYAQSQSVIQFIRNNYPAGIRKLLGAYIGGATCGGGVEQALGTTLSALEFQWRASLSPQGVWLTLTNSVGAWALLAVILSLALLPLALTRRKAQVAGRR